MAVQARAEVTRKRIIDAAVELFDGTRYGETGLADIISRAEVTKGAFYYHFPSKESVALAIIEQYEEDFRAAMIRVVGASDAPALDNIIRSTFVVAQMHRQDNLARVANQLRQSLSQMSSVAAQVYEKRRKTIFTVMTDGIRRAVAQGDVAADIDVDGLARTIWSASLGNRVLSDSIGDDMFARLTSIWQVLLRGIVPAQSLEYFHEVARRMGQQYSEHGMADLDRERNHAEARGPGRQGG
ncbi:TetR/AcrR family transcriptional regulator [Mycobacterium sp. DL592]|uniref:TetR/AcrR family transcriptional regulator n=1 Tax=Mycobacterium sp. DL592 TaxID=2675524 RepID=UPI00142480A2|nr:TetR/AcrR family transcriptional regulator [Mycobacterium sp. DL592]